MAPIRALVVDDSDPFTEPIWKAWEVGGVCETRRFFFLVETKYLYKDPGEIYVMLDL